LRIFSPEPSAIRFFFALMLAYKPFGLLGISRPSFNQNNVEERTHDVVV
jgi:hypothetical protein